MITIFLIEDNDSIRFLSQKLLTRFGYEVIGTANNGMEAIERFTSFPKKPDVIIIDYQLPLKNGIEAMKAILQIDAHAKIIFASPDPGINKLALSSGAINCILKPFKMDILISSINRALGPSKAFINKIKNLRKE